MMIEITPEMDASLHWAQIASFEEFIPPMTTPTHDKPSDRVESVVAGLGHTRNSLIVGHYRVDDAVALIRDQQAEIGRLRKIEVDAIYGDALLKDVERENAELRTEIERLPTPNSLIG
jgi:hypothetical protein